MIDLENHGLRPDAAEILAKEMQMIVAADRWKGRCLDATPPEKWHRLRPETQQVWIDTASRILAALEIVQQPEVAKLVADAEARGMERAAQICAGLADQVSDAALTGLPEQARLRESMEAAFTKARHAIRAEAAAIRRAAEGEKA